VAGGNNFFDLACKIASYAGKLCQVFLVFEQHVHFSGKGAYCLGCVTVGAYPKRICAFDLEQIGNLFEDGGDIGIMAGHAHSRLLPLTSTSLILLGKLLVEDSHGQFSIFMGKCRLSRDSKDSGHSITLDTAKRFSYSL
jgi:hypothetical protein